MRNKKRLRSRIVRVQRLKRFKANLALLTLTGALIYWGTGGNIHLPKVNIHFPTTHVQAEEVKIISPIPTDDFFGNMKFLQPTPTQTPTPTIIPVQPQSIDDPDKVQTQDNIESYIRAIFGDGADIAIAISHHECSPQNTTYPQCVNHSDIEDSIGIFQINLHNKYQWIHAGRIPGVTMEEKINWLKNPYNNTLYAYWVWSTSGWNPWSTYTSGAYLN